MLPFRGRRSYLLCRIGRREKAGIEETKEILVPYLQRKDRNLNRLLKYAELMKCGKAMRQYPEVLV